MKIQFKATFILLVAFLWVFSIAYAEENKPLAKTETGVTFEQALKNHEILKQQEQEELVKKLNFSLSQVIETWMAQAKANQESALGSRLEQSWEKLSLFYPVSPVHYEYYLRGYDYHLVKSDVTKTNSIVDPYKATVTIKEDLYVEKNHAPNVSDANPYFYTVSTNHTLNFEYINEKFNLINSDSKVVSIENKCPDEIKRLRL
ncbi:MAG: hypothetical protein ACYDFR_02500 [Candidatus Omnitrophota bacterium]